jgi:predicted phage baseplate assembly protein
VRFPDLELDDRRFQDLVDESRRRIGQRCPDWTDHNVASPGIVLTELFAWMTEMLAYRLNQVPDKVHLRLLELLDVRLYAPRAATTRIRFALGGPAAEPVLIPAHVTEVATRRAGTEDAVVFTTTDDRTIPVLRPTAYALARGEQERDVGIAGGVAQPLDDDRQAFGTPPEPGDALLLGFDEPLSSLLLRVDVECSEAHGAGIRPDDPPLRWEASAASGWAPAEVLRDETGGFNYGGGAIDLQLPDGHERTRIAGRDAFWVRCRVAERSRGGELTRYTSAPEIQRLTAAPIGVLAPATHSERVRQEPLGESDGTPGQTFRVRHVPALELGPAETLEVLEPGSGTWQEWERRDSFAASGPDDRHFRFDAVRGEVELGPCLRDAEGCWRRHGAVPAKDALLRLSGYRHGGGAAGNVSARTLTELRSAIPGIAFVENPLPATGGVDGETLDHARARAALELQVRDRAVTAGDFARLAEKASPGIVRAACLAPRDGGPIDVVVLPRAGDLVAGDDLLAEVAAYLDERRLLGTTVQVRGARVRPVSVAADVQVAPGADPDRVEHDVRTALDRYLDPIAGGGDGAGWEFGRTLHQGELHGVAHAVRGVQFVRILRIYEVDPTTGQPLPDPAGSRIALEPDEVIAPADHAVRAERGS